MLEKGGRPATLFPCAPEIVACRPVLALTPIGYRWGVYHLTICPTLLGFKGASLPRFIILTSYMSASVLTAAKPSSARGGARNHPNRMTNGVSVAQCRRVTNAAYDAYARSMPLNRFISINWATAGIDDGFAATSMFVKRAGEWLSKRKIPRAYLWVRERRWRRSRSHSLPCPTDRDERVRSLGEVVDSAAISIVSGQGPTHSGRRPQIR